MSLSKNKWLILLLFVLTKCSTGKEVILPFKNPPASGSIFPVKTTNSDFTFRIWMGNSTSIDRIITVSIDSLFGSHATLIEIGELIHKKKSKQYYRQIQIIPKSGFTDFIKKLNELNLMTLKSLTNQLEVVEHSPFSTYVIEIKSATKFNTFVFETYYPVKRSNNEIYDNIEKLIFEEFNIRQYFTFNK